MSTATTIVYPEDEEYVNLVEEDVDDELERDLAEGVVEVDEEEEQGGGGGDDDDGGGGEEEDQPKKSDAKTKTKPKKKEESSDEDSGEDNGHEGESCRFQCKKHAREARENAKFFGDDEDDMSCTSGEMCDYECEKHNKGSDNEDEDDEDDEDAPFSVSSQQEDASFYKKVDNKREKKKDKKMMKELVGKLTSKQAKSKKSKGRERHDCIDDEAVESDGSEDEDEEDDLDGFINDEIIYESESEEEEVDVKKKSKLKRLKNKRVLPESESDQEESQSDNDDVGDSKRASISVDKVSKATKHVAKLSSTLPQKKDSSRSSSPVNKKAKVSTSSAADTSSSSAAATPASSKAVGKKMSSSSLFSIVKVPPPDSKVRIPIAGHSKAVLQTFIDKDKLKPVSFTKDDSPTPEKSKTTAKSSSAKSKPKAKSASPASSTKAKPKKASDSAKSKKTSAKAEPVAAKKAKPDQEAYNVGDVFVNNKIQYVITYRGRDAPIDSSDGTYEIPKVRPSMISTCKELNSDDLTAFVCAKFHTPHFLTKREGITIEAAFNKEKGDKAKEKRLEEAKACDNVDKMDGGRIRLVMHPDVYAAKLESSLKSERYKESKELYPPVASKVIDLFVKELLKQPSEQIHKLLREHNKKWKACSEAGVDNAAELTIKTFGQQTIFTMVLFLMLSSDNKYRKLIPTPPQRTGLETDSDEDEDDDKETCETGAAVKEPAKKKKGKAEEEQEPEEEN
jgi:hypothetical protein